MASRRSEGCENDHGFCFKEVDLSRLDLRLSTVENEVANLKSDIGKINDKLDRFVFWSIAMLVGIIVNIGLQLAGRVM